jgi:dynein heavy chain
MLLQGMQTIGGPVGSVDGLIRLWAHEVMRVFHDRLVSEEDRGIFGRLLASTVEKQLGVSFAGAFPLALDDDPLLQDSPRHQVCCTTGLGGDNSEAVMSLIWLHLCLTIAVFCLQGGHSDPTMTALRRVLYADFLRPGGPDNQRYEEVPDVSALLKSVEDALADYNAQASRNGLPVHFPVSAGC